MNEPRDDQARAVWSAQKDDRLASDAATTRAALGRREREIRWRDRRVYLSAAIIAPAWAAALWLMPDLRVLAGSGLALAVWIVWQLYQRSAARLDPAAVDLPCVAFQRQLLSREITLRRGMPRWFLTPVIAGQVVIVFTLFSNPRFSGSRFFWPALAMFVASTSVVLVVGARRWQSEAADLQRELDQLTAP